MQTKQQWMLDFMGQPDAQFTIPVYQRVYSWVESQCEELWEDIMRCGKERVSHFMSMTLYLDARRTGSIRELDIIDGQQRIATSTIALTALRDYLRETGTVLNGTDATGTNPATITSGNHMLRPFDAGIIDADTLHNRFLVVMNGDQVLPRIRLAGRDKTTLSSLVLGAEGPARASVRVRENYDYFSRRMHEEGFDAQIFWQGMCELLVITAELDGDDKAQTIFEGLNTKGLPLTAADLMRNYLLVGKTREEQQRLYIEYWQPMEIMFEDDQLSSGSLKLNTGLRMWLAIRYRRMHISDRARTYYYFKQYMETEYDGTFEELLDEMRSFCYLWSANYECIGGRTHCSKFDWAKNGKRKTLVPPMERASDVMARVQSKSHEQRVLEAQERYRRMREADGTAAPVLKFVQSPDKHYETIEFGQWGAEPITWRVLERDGKSALVIAERVLDCMPYNSYYVTTTWAECSLRAWANADFVDGAFLPDEAALLMENKVHTPDDELWETVGGADCNDRVYLLSKEEVKQYFTEPDDRMAKPTRYATTQKIGIENGHCLWWLRSPGHGQGFVSTVWPVGGVDTAGSGVGRPGVGFRPVIRLKL